jgi:hypothetical protein
MILVDANLLIYAHDQSAAEHALARAWFEQTLARPDRVGLPWPTLLAFVRIVSNPAIVRTPITPAAAWRHVAGWLALPTVWTPQPGTRHRAILGALLADARVTSRLVPDAHLAALALEHGLAHCSTDGDFAKFPRLKWVNPLAA